MASISQALRSLSSTTRPSSRLGARVLSSSARAAAQPTQPALERLSQPAADVREAAKESINVARITSLGDEMSKRITFHEAPHRLRGEGEYSPQAIKSTETTTEASEATDLPALPETRRMADSYVEWDLPFSKDEALRAECVGGNQKVRWGKLLEYFDSGASAYKYVLADNQTVGDAAKYGIYLVTAAVSRMDILRPLEEADGSVADLRISGHVTYTTDSTLEILLRLGTLPAEGSADKSQTILLGRFLFACRRKEGGKHLIPKLIVEGDVEQELYKAGQEARAARRAQGSMSLAKVPPTEEEGRLLHQLFVGRQNLYERGASVPKEVVFMRNSELNSQVVLHPQERNVHNKIFGGYLMRLSYEIAYATASRFARSSVSLLALDELQFVNPVEIGHLLSLQAKVTYSPNYDGSSHHSFHVSVEATTTELVGEKAGQAPVQNVVFNFTFTAAKPLERHVLPKSYIEAMQYLDSRRRRQLGIQVRKNYMQ